MSQTIRSILLFFLVAVLPGAVSADEFVERIPAASPGVLRIDLDRGRVDVAVHDAREVRLEAMSRGVGAAAVHFEVQEENGTIVLVGHGDSWLDFIKTAPMVRVQAWVPHDFAVEITTDRGSIEVGDIDGGLVASAIRGEIRAARIRGPVELRTEVGPIQGDDVDGDVKASSQSGDITLSRVRGDVLADTHDGSVRVVQIEGDVVARARSQIEIDDVWGAVVAHVREDRPTTRRRAPTSRAAVSLGFH